MASSLSVNLTVNSPRKNATGKKAFKISDTLRSLLPTAHPQIEKGKPSNNHTQNEVTQNVVAISDKPGVNIKSKKPSRNISSQTIKTSHHHHEKKKKHRSKRANENLQIEWIIPDESYEKPHHQQIHGVGDQLSSTETGAEIPSPIKNVIHEDGEYDNDGQQRKSSKKKKSKCGSLTSFSTTTTHNNRLTRHKHYNNRVKPTSHNSTSIPDKNEKINDIMETLNRNNNVYRDELKLIEEKSSNEILKLENENESLQLQVYKLQQDLEDWKAKCRRQENRNVLLAKMKIMTKENQNLKDDAEVLKSVIRRLNKEMAFYQDKLRSKFRSDPHKIPFYSSSNSNSNVEGDTEEQENNGNDRWFKDAHVKLQPLLIAYDEIIEEKHEIIKDYELAMDKFKQKSQTIVHENEALHKTIADSKEKGSVSFEEWQFLYDNAVLVLEENDLLHEQVATLKRKAAVIQKTQEEREGKLQLKLSLLEEERSKMKIVTSQLDSHCKFLVEQNSKLAHAVQTRIPVEEHEASVKECKRLFEDLKNSYSEDRTNLTEKLTAVETEKQRLVDEVTDIGTENAKLLGTIKDMEASLVNNHTKLKEMYSKMEEASKAKEATTKTVNEMMAVAKEVLIERESLEQSLYEQQTLNDKMMNIRSQESELVNELREKIKIMENAHRAEVQNLLHKIKEFEQLLDTIGERHQVDIQQWKDLVQEKSKQIETLVAEKSQLAEDLETVWRATTNASKK